MPTLLTLNNDNLPYPDPIHPVIVHFVIALFAAHLGAATLSGGLSHSH